MNNSLSIMNPIQQNNDLNIQLNNEILKNQQLQAENQNLNKIIQNQKNEIKKLNSQLEIYINENKNLKLNNNQMNINMQNNLINNNEINNLKNEIINLKNQLILKDNEIIKLKNEILNLKNQLNNGKNVNLNDIIVIHFVSGDSIINKEIKCLADETFAEAEERLYQIYNEYRNTNNMFLFKGNQILRFKKIRENNIHNGDQVQLVNIDSSIIHSIK